MFGLARRLPGRWSSCAVLLAITFAAACSSGESGSPAPSVVAASPSMAASASPTASESTGLEADAIFDASVPGYEFVEVPKPLEQQARKQFRNSSRLSQRDARVDLRSITKDGTGVGVLLVVTLSPEMMALPGTNARTFAVGIAQSAGAEPKKVSLGPVDGYVIEGGGQVFVAWQKENLMLALIGQDEDESVEAAEAVAEATISAS